MSLALPLHPKIAETKVILLSPITFHPPFTQIALERKFTLALLNCESRSVVSDSLWPHGPYSPWNSPGQNTSPESLLWRIFLTHGSNPDLPHCRQDSLPTELDSPLRYNTLIIFHSLSTELILDTMIKEASFIMREVGVYLGASNPFLYSPIPLLGTLCRKITVSSRREWREGSPLVTRRISSCYPSSSHSHREKRFWEKVLVILIFSCQAPEWMF